MAGSENYCRSALRVSVAQICQNLGWNSTQTQPLELLTDILERYLEDLGTASHQYSEQYGRTQPNLNDLALTFQHMGINLGELEDYVHHVDPVPFAHEVVAFPAPKSSNLQFPNPNSRELLRHRKEHVHEHLPHMYPSMKDDVEEQTASPALGTQVPPQENGVVDASATPSVGDKRLLPPPSDPLPSGKRARVVASNLPEEAGHSQYEMTSVTMSANGLLMPIRGPGRLPDSRTPPPPIRHSLAFGDSGTAAGRGVDGSEANKENNVVETPVKEPPVRISLATPKDGTTSVSNSSSGKETIKPKSKKRDNSSSADKPKKAKKSESKSKDVKIKVVVGDSGSTSSVTPIRDTSAVPTKPKVNKSKEGKPKEAKIKEGKPKEGKTPKPKKIKLKGKSEVKKPPPTATPPAVPPPSSETASESRLKDLLLSQDKYKMDTLEQGPATTSPKKEVKFEAVPRSPHADPTLRQAFLPSDIFDSPTNDMSPERLVIAEAEGRAWEREEEKRKRLRDIDDTISAVVRHSAADAEKRDMGDQSLPSNTSSDNTLSPKKRGRPKKMKPKDKFKSSEFVADDVMMQEKDDEMGARNVQSINDTINAVIMQGSGTSTEGAAVLSTPTEAKKAKKEGKKKKSDKDKSPGVKKKLKAKLQGKSDRSEEIAAPPVDVKPFVSDKYSNAEMKVFEFGEAESPPSLPARRPSQAEREPSPPPPLLVSSPVKQGSISPLDARPIIKSPTPESAVATSASTSSATSWEQATVMPLKIGIPKEKERHKEKSKDKEHKKEKKEKRRDKEKKKKNKDKDRDRDRHDRHHHDSRQDSSRMKEETSTATGPGFKIKIKLGGNSVGSKSSSVTVTEKKPSDVVVKQEAAPSPRPEIPKLVIRRDASESGGSQKKHTSKVQKFTPVVKSEPRNTPPTLQPASPLPGTPPPPVLSPNSSPMRMRSPSPVALSPLSSRDVSPPRRPQSLNESFSFTTPQSSPPRGRRSLSPPPRTPSPHYRKSPSPVPKTPSPRRRQPSPSLSFSSPVRSSPMASRHKSPTPTPKTPSLSPAYPASSPIPSYHSPVRDKSPDALKPLFGTPEREASAPPSPLFPEAPLASAMPEVKAEPMATSTPTVVHKPKGKIGRPRSKSPKGKSPKGPSPKSPKGLGKLGKSPKPGSSGKSPGIPGKSPGRGRPPKAKTLALRAALAAAAGGTGEEPPSEVKVKAKPKPPPLLSLEVKTEEPAPSPARVEEEEKGDHYSSESPSPSNLSIAFNPGPSRQRGSVEAETVGSFIDSSTGQQVWICPACKMQDDGSPMIGCDKCDDWYHWVCVNITQEPPEEESWFCPRCSLKAKQMKPKGKRGRKKKVH